MDKGLNLEETEGMCTAGEAACLSTYSDVTCTSAIVHSQSRTLSERHELVAFNSLTSCYAFVSTHVYDI